MPAADDPLRIAIVPGVNPGKWTRAWSQRRPDRPLQVSPIAETDQRTVLVEKVADIAFVRLPIDRDGLSVIRLYEEVPVVVASRDHPIALVETVTSADLEAETRRAEPLEQAIDLVVADAGILVVPQSIARQHSRRDLVVRPIVDAPMTEIALAWYSDATTADIEEFIGIVRGRTAASSRGVPAAAPKKARRTPPRARR